MNKREFSNLKAGDRVVLVRGVRKRPWAQEWVMGTVVGDEAGERSGLIVLDDDPGHAQRFWLSAILPVTASTRRLVLLTMLRRHAVDGTDREQRLVNAIEALEHREITDAELPGVTRWRGKLAGGRG